MPINGAVGQRQADLGLKMGQAPTRKQGGQAATGCIPEGLRLAGQAQISPQFQGGLGLIERIEVHSRHAALQQRFAEPGDHL